MSVRPERETAFSNARAFVAGKMPALRRAPFYFCNEYFCLLIKQRETKHISVSTKAMKKLILIFALLIAGFIDADAQSSQQFEVQVAKQKSVLKKKLTVRFVELIEDSRCPIGTNCIWEGMAKIKINVRTSKGISKDFELTTMENSQSAQCEGYEIKLLDVNPKPAENVKIDRTKYIAKIVAKKLMR